MKLLRQYINEALTLELKRRHDGPFIARLKRSSGIGEPIEMVDIAARKIADDWIADLELDTGEPIAHHLVPIINRFVSSRWEELHKQYRDPRAAKQSMNNLLDAKFSTFKQEEPPI
jgi:hypothetical protein